jgi:hypothetical protein
MVNSATGAALGGLTSQLKAADVALAHQLRKIQGLKAAIMRNDTVIAQAIEQHSHVAPNSSANTALA